MMSYLGHSHNRNQAPLTLDMVRQYAPSAFATQPHESRSDRYTYIPTVSVIEGMMKRVFNRLARLSLDRGSRAKPNTRST